MYSSASNKRCTCNSVLSARLRRAHLTDYRADKSEWPAHEVLCSVHRLQASALLSPLLHPAPLHTPPHIDIYGISSDLAGPYGPGTGGGTAPRPAAHMHYNGL